MPENPDPTHRAPLTPLEAWLLAGHLITRIAHEARIEAGLRLIEVRARILAGTSARPGEKSRGRPVSPFQDWLRAYGIPHQTASDLMRDAGYTEEEREARQKGAASAMPTLAAHREALWRQISTAQLLRAESGPNRAPPQA